MASYLDLGYSSTMVKGGSSSGSAGNNYMYAADSALLIGGIGASQVRDGVLGSSITLDGSITIMDGERQMVVIDKDGMKVKDEAGNYDRVIIGRIS